jgi:hypothetical protein
MITRLWKVRYLRIVGMAAGAVAVTGAAVIVTASAAGVSFGTKPAATTNVAAADANTQSTACTAFMKHFADQLHKSQAEINTAFQKAIADTLADEVKSGQITQGQADAIKKKLAGQTPCRLPSTTRGHGGNKAPIGAYMQQYVTAAAAALGISEAQLKTDLSTGQSLSQVASAQHVSEADFRTKLIANLKPVLDKAVTDKKLTADQEQKIISALQTGPLPLWSTAVKHPKPAATAATTT